MILISSRSFFFLSLSDYRTQSNPFIGERGKVKRSGSDVEEGNKRPFKGRPSGKVCGKDGFSGL